ncbi:prepilin-type N-terminal cleavage/methylation domain-containing protein [Patescibacteria group bacterium]|nr:prepilin-type N-terminal cleavage/methylation domain-containing protein [Patescibacteria group bacterium]
MKQRGFTLIEILVVVGIIVLFLGLSIPQLRSFQQVSYLENTGKEVVATLRLAKSRTLASEGALQYGVYFDTLSTPNQYTLFQGSSYAARDPAEDQVTELSKTIEISVISLGGGNEVVFLRLTGQASVQGTITFRRIADPTYTKTVSILSSGTVEEGTATPPSDEDRVVDSRHVHLSYQGRDIATTTESVRLIFPDTTFSFPILDNMSADQIFWEGDVVSEGETQHLKIHTHLLNDVTQGTLFSLHRRRDKNTKSLEIELSGDATGNLISYDATGITTQGTSIYAGTPELQ